MFRRRSQVPRPHWLLVVNLDAWQLVGPGDAHDKVTFSPGQLGAQAAAIHKALAEAGWHGEPLVLGLSPDCCLAATVDVPTPQILRKPQAMRYHLEASIPWSAEEFVSDYVGHKTAAFMAAVRIEPLRTLLKGLEELDIAPTVIAPVALLALERHLAAARAPADHVLVWRHDGVAELFVVRAGQPYVWRHGCGDVVTLAAIEKLAHADSPWYAIGVHEAQLAALSAAGIEVAPLVGIDWTQSLGEAAEILAAGEAESLLNLRRDELAGERPFQALARQWVGLKAAAALLVLATLAALWIRGDRYSLGRQGAQIELAGIYQRMFPKNPLPDDILRAMRREYALLQGTRGPAKELPAGPAGEVVLERALSALPTDLRFRVPEIRVEGDRLYVSGEVRSNSDADRIAGQLRKAGFEVEPPRTQRLSDQGFIVHLTAHLTPAGDAIKIVK